MPINIKLVHCFLVKYKDLIKKCGLYIYKTKKNINTQIDLGITDKIIEDVILELNDQDYIFGPTPSEKNNGEIWGFGKDYENKEIYIKLQLLNNKEPLCWSFHIAEKNIRYPFK